LRVSAVVIWEKGGIVPSKSISWVENEAASHNTHTPKDVHLGHTGTNT